MGVASQCTYTQAVIAASGTVSGAIVLNGGWLQEIFVPDVVGTTFTFQTSHDGITYVAAYDSAGSAISVTVGDNRHVNVASKQIIANYIKIVSGSTETAEVTLGVTYLELAR